jgi:S-adenosylmethionine hydrolase
MPIVTLLSDWGNSDHYVAVLKGGIMNLVPGVSIIDISHHIRRDDLLHGAFIMKNSWGHFPKGSVHVCGLTAETGNAPALIAMHHDGHFFIGSDDGFYTMVFGEMPSESYFVLTSKGDKVMSSIKSLSQTASFLAKGGQVSEVGKPMSEHVKRSFMEAVNEDGAIRGIVIHIDTFGNLITNITKSAFEQTAQGRPFEISLRRSAHIIDRISRHYYSTEGGNVVAHFNESGYLEISLARSSAAQLLGMKYSDPVRIEFK